MNRTFVPWLDLDLTLNSGQVFNWEKIKEFYYGFFSDKIVKVKKEADYLVWQTYPEKDNFTFIQEYFHLDHDYLATLQEISTDELVKKALNNYKGLHILNHPFEQTLFSFMLATNKNIPAIKKSVKKLSEINGKSLEVDSIKFYLYPKADFFYQSSIEKLMEASVGYRAAYLKDAAEKLIASGTGASREFDREFLLAIKGVGDKVADCVLSFSLKHYDITPIDIWSDRIIRYYYKNTKLKKYSDKSKWFTKKFGNKTAWAGAVLFEKIRNEKNASKQSN
ncbi:MAG: DNA glycosylase [Candidatus Dojkabacteria bacterium]